MTLSDLGAPRLGVACDKCGRKGSYSVAKLHAERGDLRLTDFLADDVGLPERALDRLA
jgi:hypothetical protein